MIFLRKQQQKKRSDSVRQRDVWSGTHGSRVDCDGWSTRPAAVRTTVGGRHHEGVKRRRGSKDIISSVCIYCNQLAKLEVALVVDGPVKRKAVQLRNQRDPPRINLELIKKKGKVGQVPKITAVTCIRRQWRGVAACWFNFVFCLVSFPSLLFFYCCFR